MKNKHYIVIDSSGRIINGWSDGPQLTMDTSSAIFLHEGGYQFRITQDGEENPLLINLNGAHLWHYENKNVRKSTTEELAAELAEIAANRPIPEPSPEELQGQQITALELESIAQGQMLTDLDLESIENGQRMTDLELMVLEVSKNV